MNQQQSPATSSSTSIQDCLNILKQRIHGVYLASLFLAILSIVVVSLLPNVYSATTTILVDPQKIPERYVASTITSDPNARLNTLTQQVLSDSRLQEIVDTNNLYPQLRQKKSREELLDYVRQKTKIELKQTPQPDQGLSSFSISYEDEDRFLVAEIANQLASSFINWNLKLRQQQALGTTQFLTTELEEAKKNLEEQEAQMEAFRMKHVGATPDQVNVNMQTLSRLESDVQANADAISRLDQERILLTQSKPSEVRDTASLSERGRLLQDRHRVESELWNLKRQFTDTYPDVIAAQQQLTNLNDQLAALPEPTDGTGDSYDANTQLRLTLIDKELKRDKLRQAALQTQIQSYQWKVDSVPVLETQLAELTRNYETSRQNYQSLLDKTFSAGMSEELERKQQGKRFTVLDSAKTPDKPIKPPRLLFIAAGIALACLIPAAATLGFVLLMGRVKSEEDLRSVLGARLPILGTIPPIVSQADIRRARMTTLRTFCISAVSCAALLVFLFKMRPIL
jgi:succinoglycan biosynthesis transport protein ExoP